MPDIWTISTSLREKMQRNTKTREGCGAFGGLMDAEDSSGLETRLQSQLSGNRAGVCFLRNAIIRLLGHELTEEGGVIVLSRVGQVSAGLTVLGNGRN